MFASDEYLLEALRDELAERRVRKHRKVSSERRSSGRLGRLRRAEQY
jgi:hypothetical protein